MEGRSMLEFLFELERIVTKWPKGEMLTVSKIAEESKASLHTTLDCLAVALGRELDVQDVVAYDEAKEAVSSLQERMQLQLEARQRKITECRNAATKAYDLTIAKVRSLQSEKNYRNAYKTLSYFVGRHEPHLDGSLLMELYGELLRLGAKTDTATLELGLWMRKAIKLTLEQPAKENVADALDFVEAYGEFFLDGSARMSTHSLRQGASVSSNVVGQGRKILQNVFQSLEAPAQQFELEGVWRNLAVELKVAATA